MPAHQHTRSQHLHAHAHPPGERHPHAQAAPSLLRFSVAQRLAIAVVLAALLWVAVFWAIGWNL
jgi:hypothetical protein